MAHDRHKPGIWQFAVAAVILVAAFLALAALPDGTSRAEEEAAGEAAVEVAAEEGDEEEEAEGEEEEEGDEEPLVWERPRFEDRAEERERMVRTQMARRDIESEAVLEAMRQVPRHLFVPASRRRGAHADHPLPIGHGQTISQPYIVALMTEVLALEAGDKVLEIGTGSAYQAAVLTELTPYVYSIEIIEELAAEAAERLDDLGYHTCETKQGDGYYGWEEHAPFDGIIVTAAAGHVPPPLLEQLAPGGRMIIPVGGVYEVQRLIMITRDEEGRVRTRNVLPVRFVPMTGRVQRPE